MEKTPLIAHPVHVGFFHPAGPFFKWLVLAVISFICFGNYFAYDEIEPFDKKMSNIGINETKFGLLYTVYSIPNTVLVFFGGILGDKIGLRLSGFIFVTLVVLGAVIVALAPTLHHLTGNTWAFVIMCIGRVIFGCGAESLNVIQNSMISRWFAGGRNLALAMGIVLSTSRLGDFIALFFAANIAQFMGGYVYVYWFGAILCGVSLVAVIIYCVMDKATEKYFTDRTVNPEENALNFRAVFHFDPRFWLVAIVCCCYYGGIFPFVSIASQFLIDEYGFPADGVKAGHYASIVTLASMILSPFLGKFLDTVGWRPAFVVLGSLAVIPTHICLAFRLAHPIIPIIIMGLSFSLVPSALWPAIPIITKEKEIATAFGVMAAIQNSGLALINYVAGKIGASHYHYAGSMWFFVGMDCIGLLFAIMLFFLDRMKGGQLCGTAKGKKEVATFDSSAPATATAHFEDPSPSYQAGAGGNIQYD
eukprot:TRINITY_DN1168_c0_g1_i1.p1 TRINITY_DN1168_c0_g1~~TRINITY_DN1168_c0_g1_i1.p1  ORF type:complete len:492 (+),score=113.30 TRINITY_DN1168_c0_g1_i1:49-1476(+)